MSQMIKRTNKTVALFINCYVKLFFCSIGYYKPENSQWNISDFVGCIKLMIARGARVNAKDFAGHTPLHLCTGLYCNRL